jgi:hypothetical protein
MVAFPLAANEKGHPKPPVTLSGWGLSQVRLCFVDRDVSTATEQDSELDPHCITLLCLGRELELDSIP